MKNTNLISAVFLAAGLCSAQIAAGQTNPDPMRPSIGKSKYNTAIGLRAGETSGMTIKHFFNETSAFEGIIGVWPYALGLTALYERHEAAFNVEGMNWYYGAGAHATLGTGRVYYWYRNGDRYYYRYRSGNMGLGVDGILGLEYKIKAIPFALSLDIKPFMEVNTIGGVYLSLDPGLGIKVAF